jgi:hypothetical protein
MSHNVMANNMYERAGLSSLERLVGRTVSAMCFVQNYVQVGFDELILTCYTNPSVFISEEKANIGTVGYRDRLCELIGKSVQSVTERPREELSIYFDGGDHITISLQFKDATSVEAAMLHQLGGDIFDVWRYE